MPTPAKPAIITVSQLNLRAKQALEGALPNVWIQGELSNLSQPSSGHWYFTLKDSCAQVRCAMFRGRNMMVRTPLNAGDHVVVNASVSLYEGRGDYQLIVDSLQKAGLGDLHQQYETLKAALAAEGLFEAETKRQLPQFPATIGVISSPTGAAVHDILTVLKRRYPVAQVIIYPALVQGAEAPASLINALALANAQQRCELLIVGRGGGSLEDLWAFNNEAFVRALYESATPVISAVGHEIDFTLADFVADLRAPTPSAAAEAATPDAHALRQLIKQRRNQLTRLMQAHIHHAKQRLNLTQNRLQNPVNQLQQQRQRLDYAELQLKQALTRCLIEKKIELQNFKHQLQLASPAWQLKNAQRQSNDLQHRLATTFKQLVKNKRQQLGNAANLLNSLSPLQTLQRGYAIAANSEGHVISSVHETAAGQPITLKLRDGQLQTRVEAIQPKNLS
ncbi:MAG: exodeoxyribonuclease VII large subunit [Marinagarivorans sp.]|nr:exodeoxyribonuclease VII large subunit [Marinagarivorans sp.]